MSTRVYDLRFQLPHSDRSDRREFFDRERCTLDILRIAGVPLRFRQFPGQRLADDTGGMRLQRLHQRPNRELCETLSIHLEQSIDRRESFGKWHRGPAEPDLEASREL